MKNSLATANFWENPKDFDSLPADYPTWSAQEKQNFLWNNRIVPSIYERKPPLAKIDIWGLITTPLKIKMDRLTDEAPAKWEKAIHAHGSVAKIKWIAESECPFTGLFQGAEYGLLRASLAEDPARGNFSPGLGIKLLVDGQDSGNFSALVSLVGQGKNYNFFANQFSNIVPVVNELRPKIANLIFRRVTRYPTKLSLEHLAVMDQWGNPIKKAYYPEQIFLEPNPDIQFAESPTHDFRDDLETIPSGSLIFSLYSINPKATEAHQQAQPIGRIETTSQFVTSFYGDRRLFFRHQRFRNL